MTPAAPGLGRARSARGRDTRAAILETALRLFDERGYLGVRVEDIANEAGVSRATFYKHFAERDEILGELFAELIGGAVPVEVAPPAEHDIEAHVVAILGASVTRMLENERLARFVYSLPVRHDAVLPGGTAAPPVFSQVRECLAEATADGAIRDDVPLERILEVLGRVFEASMRDWAEHGTDPRDALAELCSIVFRGVATPRVGTRAKRSR
jgi:AcrR family transcriptional regulator